MIKEGESMMDFLIVPIHYLLTCSFVLVLAYFLNQILSYLVSSVIGEDLSYQKKASRRRKLVVSEDNSQRSNTVVDYETHSPTTTSEYVLHQYEMQDDDLHTIDEEFMDEEELDYEEHDDDDDEEEEAFMPAEQSTHGVKKTGAIYESSVQANNQGSNYVINDPQPTIKYPNIDPSDKYGFNDINDYVLNDEFNSYHNDPYSVNDVSSDNYAIKDPSPNYATNDYSYSPVKNDSAAPKSSVINDSAAQRASVINDSAKHRASVINDSAKHRASVIKDSVDHAVRDENFVNSATSKPYEYSIKDNRDYAYDGRSSIHRKEHLRRISEDRDEGAGDDGVSERATNKLKRADGRPGFASGNNGSSADRDGRQSLSRNYEEIRNYRATESVQQGDEQTRASDGKSQNCEDGQIAIREEERQFGGKFEDARPPPPPLFGQGNINYADASEELGSDKSAVPTIDKPPSFHDAESKRLPPTWSDMERLINNSRKRSPDTQIDDDGDANLGD